MNKQDEEKARETYPLPRGCKDYIDQSLLDEMRLFPGCCSSIECLKYNIAREVAIKMAAWKEQQMIEKAWDWFMNKNGFNDYNTFKKYMEEQ